MSHLPLTIIMTKLLLTGRHALHLATLNRHLDVVDELLNRGADPDAADQRGMAGHIGKGQGWRVTVVCLSHRLGLKQCTCVDSGSTPLLLV